MGPCNLRKQDLQELLNTEQPTRIMVHILVPH